MANQKTASKNNDNKSGSRAVKKSDAPTKKSVAAAENAGQDKKMKLPRNPDSLGSQLAMCAVGLLGLLLGVCFILTDLSKGAAGRTGPVGYVISAFFNGMFGMAAYFIPLFMLIYAAMWKHLMREKKMISRALTMLLTVTLISSLIHVAFISAHVVDDIKFYDVAAIWKFSIAGMRSGVIGGLLGGGLYAAVKVIAWPIIIIAVIFSVMAMFELTPNMIVYLIRQGAKRSREKRLLRQEEARSASLAKKAEKAEKEEKLIEEKRKKELEEEERKARELEEKKKCEAEKKIDLPVQTPVEKKKDKSSGEGASETGKRTVGDIDLAALFSDDDDGEKDEGKGGSSAVATDIHGNEQVDFEAMSQDLDIETGETESDDKVVEVIRDERKGGAAKNGADKNGAGKEGGQVKVTREKLTPDRVPEETPAPEYNFPPIDLLNPPEKEDRTGDKGSLDRTGRKLVETLRSFKVDVDIVNISQGPTITRYELAPKAGVRVRAIANLVDDIALALESDGIRIEAPIPGKAAVGVEVPNKNLTTVHLRELIDSPKFASAKSKLYCCLGKSVSGDPIYLDIAAMPHLLIAGTTGSGKSACINALLISLLYRAKPDEVKLVLIDPKKIELNIYRNLPHLLVPVVNDPKMAAGSLAWAVTEMERRFELIEEVGVRDLNAYNQVTAGDPDKEYLPRIVIVIDELADLMLTAPDDVETYICRIAQKARAAGIHLVIGTQRPSVDIITGLIKANIPSRIAFTVAQAVDSRVILDMTGAEKLIGRGDMLYNPVGAMKPMRAQGAYVDEFEVTRVTDFIREQARGSYDDQILKEIDKNARQCGQKKSAQTDGEGEDAEDLVSDPKFFEAVDIALETGKISTSLLQRRASIGYGRAAKLIDIMTTMHIVSPPDGQKPRNVLITATDWAQMKMRMNDGAGIPGGGYGGYSDGGFGDGDDGGYSGDDGGDGGFGDDDEGRPPFTEDDFDDDAPF